MYLFACLHVRHFLLQKSKVASLHVRHFLLQKSKVSLSGSIRQNQKRKLSERHCSMTEKIEVLRVALESLGWSRKDVCDVITSRLQLAFPVDHLWAGKKCKNLKFTSALGVLLTLGEVRDLRSLIILNLDIFFNILVAVEFVM